MTRAPTRRELDALLARAERPLRVSGTMLAAGGLSLFLFGLVGGFLLGVFTA
jgi:hypothetical protein